MNKTKAVSIGTVLAIALTVHAVVMTASKRAQMEAEAQQMMQSLSNAVYAAQQRRPAMTARSVSQAVAQVPHVRKLKLVKNPSLPPDFPWGNYVSQIEAAHPGWCATNLTVEEMSRTH